MPLYLFYTMVQKKSKMTKHNVVMVTVGIYGDYVTLWKTRHAGR